MKVFAVLLAGLVSSACSTSLPRLPEKALPFPELRGSYDSVAESREEWLDESRRRNVPVTIYTPAGASGRLPVVVFSHGIGENRDSYAYLGRAAARHGFLSVHITHAGTDKAVLERGYLHLYRAVKEPENWANRAVDISFVLDRLETRDDTDLSRVAVAGHSAGAYTAFAVAGVTLHNGIRQRDPRVKKIVAMSMPRLDGIIGDYNVGISVLNITGTHDTSIVYRTFPRHRRIPFEQSTGQTLVTIEGVDHDMFSAQEERRHPLIAALMVAFLTDETWFRDAGTAVVDGVRMTVETR